MSKPRGDKGTPTMDLIEESVALLRAAPASAHFTYYLGAIPFWLGLLYFLSDMSHNAYAVENVATGSLLVALLYVWNKCWQTVSASHLTAALSGRPGEPWTAHRVLRMVASQAAIQPWGILLRPIAVHAIIPAVWGSAVFHHATVTGDGSPAALSKAAGHARRWGAQAHGFTSCLWGFSIFVFINVFVTLAAVPYLLKTLFGIESAYSRSMDAMVNTTFLSVAVALTSLAVDPLRRAIYIIRTFRSNATKTGEDLTADLRAAKAMPNAALAALLLCACVLPGGLRAQEAPLERSTPPAASADARELDRKIHEVLERREFAWKAPRERQARAEAGENKGVLQGWIDSIGKSLGKVADKAFEQVRKIIQAIRKLFSKAPTPAGGAGRVDWVGLAKAAGVIVAAVLVLLAAWLIYRAVSGKRRPVAAAVPQPAVPDLRSENVVADQLPEDGWLALAREHAARGDLPLALRAAWLAGLAHLGQRELIGIARYKSNCDYHRELRRRARDREPLLEAFDDNLLKFERSWYGNHSVEMESYERFQANLERIRGA